MYLKQKLKELQLFRFRTKLIDFMFFCFIHKCKNLRKTMKSYFRKMCNVHIATQFWK